MKSTLSRVVGPLAVGLTLALPACASEPIIPPTLATISPAGMERGTTKTFSIEGRNLSDATEVIFDAPGITGSLTEIADVPEKITGPRAGEDLSAQVPLGKKQTAKLEVTIAKDAAQGIHRFRVKTPLGTSNMLEIAVGTLPEVMKREKPAMDAGTPPQSVELPATLVGALENPGETDTYQFKGKAGAEIVFLVQASALGSKLTSTLTLNDSDGHMLASAGQNSNRPDAELNFRLPRDGTYTISICDRENGGGKAYFYRLDAGQLPYVKNVFPLGVRKGEPSQIVVSGANLGPLSDVKINPPASDEGWTTMPLDAVGSMHPLNEVKLAVGDAPEVAEHEPNDSFDAAQTVSIPVTVNGHIAGGLDRGKTPDEDYFRFTAKKGQKLNIEVAAARLGSPLDSVIEILDAKGNAIPRATIRCLNETTTTLADRDSRTDGIRLVSTSGLREGDYLMVGDELDRIDFIPDQPDADTVLKSMGDLRIAYLGTSPDVHAVNTPVYKALILPPDADFPSNGLPVFHLTWRNDDGGPGYGSDSKLDFLVPADGDYFLHLKDVRGMEGSDFAYRLSIHEEEPDFRLKAEPENPNIPRGGTTAVTVSLDAIQGFDGPIDIEVTGLPRGVSASKARILPGQISTVVPLTAAPDADSSTHPMPIRFVGHANVNGRAVTRMANRDGSEDQPLQLVSVTPAPDVTVSTDATEVALEPGKEIKVTLNVQRHNGFAGRVPCEIENLPPGVRVVNVGLNGVLVTEAQTSRTFTLRAEDWAKPIDQPIYVVAEVESNSPTKHPSAPVLLKVAAGKQASAEAQSHTSSETGNGASAPNH
ncbi:MAG: PPC domain-containing protein [Terracidiphilus sp.]